MADNINKGVNVMIVELKQQKKRDQEAFDTVVQQLFTQRCKARSKTNGVKCYYRTEDGLKCAVGALIPDDEYRTTMEGNTASRVRHLCPSLKNLDPYFLDKVQATHDTCDPHQWGLRLAKIAGEYDLSMYVLLQQEPIHG